jgi:hypothetical protein
MGVFAIRPLDLFALRSLGLVLVHLPNESKQCGLL